MRQEQLEPGEEVPVDAVTASASGVDPHISEDNATHPGPSRGRRARNAARAGARAGRRAHRRPRPRRARRAGRKRARAEPRLWRRCDSALPDRRCDPWPASRSWTRGCSCATRSCSWSRSAPLITTFGFLKQLLRRRATRRRRRAHLVHGRRCRCGCGSPSCSRTSPRRSPRAAARHRPTRCARSAARRPPGFGTAARSPPRNSSAATWSSSRPARSSPATAPSSRASLRWTSRP